IEFAVGSPTAKVLSSRQTEQVRRNNLICNFGPSVWMVGCPRFCPYRGRFRAHTRPMAAGWPMKNFQLLSFQSGTRQACGGTTVEVVRTQSPSCSCLTTRYKIFPGPIATTLVRCGSAIRFIFFQIVVTPLIYLPTDLIRNN